jgi:amidohydrolase
VLIGTKTNILPTGGSFAGTIRYYDAAENARVVRRVDELLGGIARAHGAGYQFRYEPGYPATVNDPEIAALARAAVAPVARVTDYRTMGAEDMSYFLERVPGCYYNVGSRNAAKGKVHGHHSGSFDIDEDALVLALEVGTRVLESYLSRGGR